MIILKCDRCGVESKIDPTFINSVSAFVGKHLTISVHNKDGDGFHPIHLCDDCDHIVGACIFNDERWEDYVCSD